MASESSAEKIDTFIDEKYTPLDKKIKILLAVLLLALPIAAFYFGFFSSKQAELAKLKTEEDKLSEEVDKARKAAANLQHHKNELAEAQKKFDKISVVLPKEQEIPDLLRKISDLGKNVGLDFISFKPGTEVPKDFYAEIPLNIEIRGPYHNMGSFLDRVSGLERIVTVDNIKMGKPKEEDGEILLESSCNLLTYRFTDQKLKQ